MAKPEPHLCLIGRERASAYRALSDILPSRLRLIRRVGTGNRPHSVQITGNPPPARALSGALPNHRPAAAPEVCPVAPELEAWDAP
jgi:hypothetical protein